MMSAKFVGIFRTFDPLPLLPSVLPCGTIPNPNSFHIWYHSRNAQCPEELPPEGVSDEAVDGEVGRGVEHHERVRDVGHHLAPVRRQVRPVRRDFGAPGGESNALSMTLVGQIIWDDIQMVKDLRYAWACLSVCIKISPCPM